MQRTYRLVNTASTRRNNVYNYTYYPIVLGAGNLEPGKNTVVYGVNLFTTKQVIVSNSTYSATAPHYFLANDSIKISSPSDLIISQNYDITVIAESGSGTLNNATPSFANGQVLVYSGPSLSNSFNWTVPIGVTNVSIIAIGAGGYGSTVSSGGGGGGGGLIYVNNFPVTEGQVLTLSAGSPGRISSISNSTIILLAANSGANASISSGGVGGNTISNISGTVGWSGGRGGSSLNYGAGGGGAAGYSGKGGDGVWSLVGAPGANGSSGAGGGGGGGGASSSSASIYYGGGGGGVGIFGEGTSGLVSNNRLTGSYAAAGGNGSGGISNSTISTSGGVLGGGGAGGQVTVLATSGGIGAVRIIWGNNRAFPNTNTDNF